MSVTLSGARANARAANRPPNPPPTITTRGTDAPTLASISGDCSSAIRNTRTSPNHRMHRARPRFTQLVRYTVFDDVKRELSFSFAANTAWMSGMDPLLNRAAVRRGGKRMCWSHVRAFLLDWLDPLSALHP